MEDYEMLEDEEELDSSEDLSEESSWKWITTTFIIISFIIAFFFGNIIFVLFLLIRLIYSKEKVKEKLERLIGDINENHYLFDMSEENKLDVLILGVLNISIISSFFFFIASINHFFNISYNLIYWIVFSISFLLFIIFYKRIFYFFFWLENNLTLLKKSSSKIEEYKRPRRNN